MPYPPSDDEEAQGMCEVVSTDVQDAVFAVCAEMLPGFTGTSPIDFQPLSDEDEDQADLETKAVNHVAQNAGFYLATAAAVQEAMLRRAGIIKVNWLEKTEVEYEDFEDVPIQMLPQVVGEDEVIAFEENEGIATISVRRYNKCQKPILDAVPIDEFLTSANVASPNVEECRFNAHQRPVTRSELVELGIDKVVVDQLSETTDASTNSDYARARDTRDAEMRSGHRSTEYVMVVESYYNIDFDGDGIAELRRIVTAGGSDGTDELLLNEPWPAQPFCVGVGYLGVFSWDGVSLFDRLKMIQDVKTDLVREVTNATKRNVRQRIGVVEDDGEPDDIMTSQMGGYIRMRTPNGIVPIPDVQVPPQAYQLLEYLDSMRHDKGGAAIDATASATAVNQGGDWSLERVQSAIEQLNAMVAKNLTETLIKPLFRKLHHLLRRFQNEDLMVPGSSGWKSTNPKQWNPRENMVISMGMSVGERSQRIQGLTMIQQQHASDAQTGLAGIMSDLPAVYQARIDMARLTGLTNPEQYFVDPASPQSQQAQQAQAEQASQQQQAQQAQAEQTMQFQYSLMTDIEKVKNQGKLQQQMMQNAMKEIELAIKAFGERVDLVKVEADIDAQDAQQEIDRMQNEPIS